MPGRQKEQAMPSSLVERWEDAKLGEKIADFVNEEQVLEIIQRCLDLYLEHGIKRERFSDLIDRVGVERFKAAVLGQEVPQGAVCD